MRWNAVCLCIPLLAIVIVLGCKSPDKAGPDAHTAGVLGDTYALPAYGDLAPQMDTYADEPGAAPVERSFASRTPPEVMEDTPRYHTVVKKDTLYKLARMYYSDEARWKELRDIRTYNMWGEHYYEFELPAPRAGNLYFQLTVEDVNGYQRVFETRYSESIHIFE